LWMDRIVLYLETLALLASFVIFPYPALIDLKKTRDEKKLMNQITKLVKKVYLLLKVFLRVTCPLNLR